MQPNKYNPNNHSGKFNHRLIFQKLSEEEKVDEKGYPIENWISFQYAWAMIKTLQGREYYQAATTQNENTLRFVIRYTNNLHPDMRILYKDRIFNIESIINDDEANRTLTIIVKEAIK